MYDTTALILCAFFVILYFIPALVAGRREHPNRLAIGLLNLFLGWTVLGWIGALVWAATAIDKKEPRNV